MSLGRVRYAVARNDAGAWGVDTGAVGLLVAPVWRSTEVDVDGRWVDDVEPAERWLSPRERVTTRLEVGDILITKASGSAAHVGKAALVGESQAGGGFSNFVQRLRTVRGQSPAYFWYLLNSSLARAYYDRWATTTSGLKNINGSLIGNVPLPISEGARQAAIGEFLDRECDRAAAVVAAAKRTASVLAEQQRAAFDRLVVGMATAPLRYLVEGIDQGWSPECDAHVAAPGEWAYSRLGA